MAICLYVCACESKYVCICAHMHLTSDSYLIAVFLCFIRNLFIMDVLHCDGFFFNFSEHILKMQPAFI